MQDGPLRFDLSFIHDNPSPQGSLSHHGIVTLELSHQAYQLVEGLMAIILPCCMFPTVETLSCPIFDKTGW